LRRHHEVRRDRTRRSGSGSAGGSARAAGGAPGGDQCRAGPQAAGRKRACPDPRARHGGRRPQDRRAYEGVMSGLVGKNTPLVVRLEGTNVELGRKLLAESGLALTPALDMADGARKIVELTRAS